MVFDFIHYNIQQCIRNENCIYNHIPVEDFYSLKIKNVKLKLTITIYLFYTPIQVYLYMFL